MRKNFYPSRGVFCASSGIFQSIAGKPHESRNAFTCENGRLPKKPRYALRGLGCGLSRIRRGCGLSRMIAAFFCACAPQSTNAIGCGKLPSAAITASVNVCQPKFLCAFALCACTERTVLSKNTPCLAQLVRSPLFAAGTERSASSSF